VSSLKQDIQKSEGWRIFPILDILASLAIAGVAVALERIYGGNAPFAIALLLAVGGFSVALPVDYAGHKRWSRKTRGEAIKGVIYCVRIFLVIAIFSAVSSLLLKYI
jgi:hypothetical protein